jgi:hypothetical protein
MRTHQIMAPVLFMAASLTAAGLMLHSAPARAVASCGPTQQVTPSTLNSAVKGDGCRILVMAAGQYPRFNITSHAGGVLTMRCASAGGCEFQPNNRATGVDGLIIDGMKVTGGQNGLYVQGKNIVVQNSTFIEQTSSGITVIPGTQSDNIQMYGNEFRNAKLGCDYTNPDNCTGYLSDGTPVSEMDYGVRIHDTRNVKIKGNTFGTVFNHAISIKYSVVNSIIADNNFIGCGRACIDFGQESPASTEGTITGNMFGPYRKAGVNVRWMRRSVITGNIFTKSPGADIRVISVPLSRVIIQSPNTTNR